MTFANDATQAAAEIGQAVAAIDPAALDGLVKEIAEARRIVCHGVGREGLMMRALAMRLFHMGCDVHVTGDMTCPPLGAGDLFLASAGPGMLATVSAFLNVAHDTGARTACITAQPDGATARLADRLLVIPAQTMANDQGAGANSVLPMGSLFEGAQFLAFELLVLRLREKLGVTPEAMRARHTNLE